MAAAGLFEAVVGEDVLDRRAVDARREGADDDEAADDQCQEQGEDKDEETAHAGCRGPLMRCAVRVGLC